MNATPIILSVIFGLILIFIVAYAIIRLHAPIVIDISGKRNVDYDFEVTKWLNAHWNEIDKTKSLTFQFMRYYKNSRPKMEYRVTYSIDDLERLHQPIEMSPSFVKEQRRLMTPKLRHEIMERDNYTCQICGRYMPDGNGLHIDHIIPVSKGGKTEPDNLQVLCQKCNNHKSNK